MLPPSRRFSAASAYVRAVALAFAALALAGCRCSPSDAARGAASSAPGRHTAVAPLELSNATLQKPRALAPGERRPLLVLLHGYGDSGEHFAESSGWARFAAAERLAWLAPDGSLDREGRRFWSSGPGCCNFDGLPLDHLGAVEHLIDRAVASGAVDPGRVYAIGFSNGGFLAHRLACRSAGRLRGIASLAGGGPLPTEACPERGPLRVLQVHGDQDPIVPYGGGRVFRHGAYREDRSAVQASRDWAERLGCASEPRPLDPLDLERALPGAETHAERFERCARGAVELWTVRGAKHLIGFDRLAPPAIWSFLDAS